MSPPPPTTTTTTTSIISPTKLAPPVITIRPACPSRALPLLPDDSCDTLSLPPDDADADALSLPSYVSKQPDEDMPPIPPTSCGENEEEDEMQLINWRALRNWRNYVQRKHIPSYLILLFLVGTAVPVAIEHKQLVYWAQPFIKELKRIPGGWLIPIIILFIISFPPLFGHEIVAVVVGLVWGFGRGFAIVACGSVLGEIGNFYAFRYLCGARGHRAEKHNMRYACLARIIREGGFLIAVVARLSAIPGHLTTAVFSTCGMHFLVFSAAAILSMPKQMVTVYLGVILLQSADGRPESPRTKALSACVILLTVLVTIFAALWIYYKMAMAFPKVLEERRLARLARDGRPMTSLSQLALPVQPYTTVAPGSPTDLYSSARSAMEVSRSSLPLSVDLESASSVPSVTVTLTAPDTEDTKVDVARALNGLEENMLMSLVRRVVLPARPAWGRANSDFTIGSSASAETKSEDVDVEKGVT